MRIKVKKLLIPLVAAGALLLMGGGVLIGALMTGAIPSAWSWVKQSAPALAQLHPEAAELVAGLRQLDPSLQGALSAMGHVTLEPEALLAQLAAAAVPAGVLDGLSPTEINQQLAAWGMPVRVAEPAGAVVAGGAVAAGAAASGAAAAEGAESENEEDHESEDDPE